MHGVPKRRPPSQAASRDPRRNLTLPKEDEPEEPVRIARTSRKKELIRLAIGCASPAKLNAPQSVDEDRITQGIPHRVHELPGGEIEAVDRSPSGIVGDQQRIAQWPKVRGSHRETPWLVE